MMESNSNIPIKLDLVISCKVEQLFSDQVGGNPDSNLLAINNLEYQCISSPNNEFSFYYDQSNTKIYNKSKYLGKGANTVVMSLIQIKGITSLNGKQFVLRVTELNNNFNIQKYLEDKALCGRYIPTAYYYGTLFCDAGVKLNYVIAQKCEVFIQNNIDNLNYFNKNVFLMDLINCLIILQNNNYALWDLKLQNIGYGNNYNCVIIDYDEHTILPINKSSSANTYYPTYVYINYLSFKNKYNDNTFINNINLNKIPVAGLADVILGLFFKIKQNEEITSASLYNLHEGGTFKSAYSNNSSTFHIYSTNPNKANWWTESFLNLVNGKKIQEYLSLLSVNNAWENQHTKLINILFNYEYYTGLLSPEYSKIPTFEEVRRELYDSSTYSIPMEIDKFDMVGGSNIAYKKKYEKYLNQNKNLIDEINNNI